MCLLSEFALRRPERSGDREPFEARPGSNARKRKDILNGYPSFFLVNLRARDVAERPVDVRFATTGTEWRPRTVRGPAGLERKKKEGYPQRISFLFLVNLRARDGTRTRDPDLGKVVLHQLSHSRILNCCSSYIWYSTTSISELQALFEFF